MEDKAQMNASKVRKFQAFFLVQLGLFLVCNAYAEKAFLNFSIWNRSLVSSRPSPGYPNSYETILHLDFSQDVTNYGNLFIWFDGLASGRDRSVSQWSLYWTGFKVGKLTFNTKLGDSYFQFTNADSRFINVFHPYMYLRGLALSLESRDFDLTFYGGKVARLSGLLGSTYKVGDQSLYGLKARYKAQKKWILGAGYIHTVNEKDQEGSLITKENDIFMLDSEYTIYPGITVLGEFQRSFSRDGLSAQKTNGSYFRIGPLVKIGKIDFEANYRYVDSQFRFISQESQVDRDEKGLFSSLRYQASRNLFFFGVMESYRDNAGTASQRNMADNLQVYSGFSIYSTSLPDFTAQFEYGERESEGIFPYYVKSRTTGLFVQVSKNWGRYSPYLRFRLQRYRDEAAPERNYTFPTTYLGLRYSLRGGSFIWFEGELDQRFDYLKQEVQRSLNLRTGWSHSFSLKLSLYAELYYHRLGIENILHQLEAFLGIRYDLPWEMTLRVDFRTLTPLSRTDRPSSHWITLKLNKRFEWGAPAKILGRGLAMEVMGAGNIEGFVFEDKNRDGLIEPGEKGVAGVPLSLEDGSLTVTDTSGKYRFSNVAEGNHQVRVEEKKIPASFYILSSLKTSLLVEPRKTHQLNFTLISGATLSGRIIEDLNGNGKIDPDEKGLSDVLIYLIPVQKEGPAEETKYFQNLILNTYTDSEGNYVFDNIIPSEYELSLDEETLPKGAKPAIALPLRIKLEPGQKLEDQDILVLPRPIIFHRNH